MFAVSKTEESIRYIGMQQVDAVSLAQKLSTWTCQIKNLLVDGLFLDEIKSCCPCCANQFKEPDKVAGRTKRRLNDLTMNILCQGLMVNQSLVKLELHGHLFTVDGANGLSQILRKNASITYLSLSKCFIGDEGITAILSALEKNSKVSTLRLNANGLHSACCSAIAHCLSKNKTLTDLDLNDNDLQSDGLLIILEALSKNITLKAIDLTATAAGIDGARHIAAFLRDNCQLQRLDISYNHFGNEGARLIYDAMATNTCLLSLDLAGNGITSANDLAKLFKSNNSLQKLYWRNNIIKDGYDLSEFSCALAQSTLLRFVDLQACGFDESTEQAWVDIISQNQSLTHLDLRHNRLRVEEIFHAMETNRSLIELDFRGAPWSDETTNVIAETLLKQFNQHGNIVIQQILRTPTSAPISFHNASTQLESIVRQLPHNDLKELMKYFESSKKLVEN